MIAGILVLPRRYPMIAAGAILLAAILLTSLFAPLLTTHDPRALSVVNRLQAPSALHWFGTDGLGRDLYARVLYGGRVSLLVGASTALASAVFGLLFGFLGTAGTLLGAIVMSLMDGMMAIPAILLAIALVAVTGASVTDVIAAVTIVETPRAARLVRSVVQSLRMEPYVDAAITCGSPPSRIILRHILPGVAGPLLVQATYIWSAAMLMEAALSFVGAGPPPTIPSWGNVMASSKELWQVAPHLVFIPAAFLLVTLLSVNLLGDGLRNLYALRSSDL